MANFDDRIDNLLSSGLYAVVTAIAEQADVNMTEDRWFWPRRTVRANGSIVYSPRDIYDTGELFRSQRSYTVGNEGEIFYDCDYAAEVHTDRPWLETAAHEVNVEKVFADKLRELL